MLPPYSQNRYKRVIWGVRQSLDRSRARMTSSGAAHDYRIPRLAPCGAPTAAWSTSGDCMLPSYRQNRYKCVIWGVRQLFDRSRARV